MKRVNHSSAFNLDEIPDVSSGRDRELVAINDALKTLAEMDPRKARVIELRFFGVERGRDGGGSEDFAADCDARLETG